MTQSSGNGSQAVVKQLSDEMKVFSELAQKDRQEALRELEKLSFFKAEEFIKWYQNRLRPKRFWAITLRLLAILFGGLATIVPILLPIILPAQHQSDLLRALVPISSVLVALAVLCVSFDKFFGFSNGWMRYISAMLELQSRRDAFYMAWAKGCARCACPPTDDQFNASLDQLASFVAAVDDVVRTETQSWVTEFRGALAEIDKSLADTRTSLSSTTITPRGALEICVSDCIQLDDQCWNACVGDIDLGPQRAKNRVAVTELTPGLTRVAISAKQGGKEVCSEKIVVIEPAKITSLEMKLLS